MKQFLKDCVSDLGILGTLAAGLCCVVFSPVVLLIALGLGLEAFNDWSTTWFDSGEGENKGVKK